MRSDIHTNPAGLAILTIYEWVEEPPHSRTVGTWVFDTEVKAREFLHLYATYSASARDLNVN